MPVLAAAEEPGVVSRQRLEPEILRQRAEEADKKQKKLEQDKSILEKELEASKGRLVSTGKSIQDNEWALQKLEKRIAQLEKEKVETENRLEDKKKSSARLLAALHRLRRTPPEALVMQPEAPLQTAQTAMLLKHYLPRLHAEVRALSDDFNKLSSITADLALQRQDSTAKGKALEKERAQLADLLDKKMKIYERKSDDLERQRQDAQRLSEESRDLQDFLQRMERQDTGDRESGYLARKEDTRRPVAKSGKSQLPLYGVILTRFQEPDGFGSPSMGVRIGGRAGALIVAPMDGEVRFAGPFKNYGKLIIIEHANGYHSLIAGFDRIDTVIGHSVSAGEPLGKLQNGSGSGQPVLYFELRHNGKTIDPARKFSDLG